MTSMYNEDYYERGIELGISGYSNFRWMPEMTIPMCHHLSRHLKFDQFDSHRILDYGCAKGYVVKALRLLGYDAFGVDCSEYAISQADSDVMRYVYCSSNTTLNSIFCKDLFTHVIAKDVFEHINYDDIKLVLKDIRTQMIKNGLLYVLVPLADNGTYRVPFYENDITHVIRENEHWWSSTITNTGFKPVIVEHKLRGIKDNWSSYNDGNLQAIFCAI